ncbi:hypothetical protein ACFX2I_009119 [Malus domestica]
MGVAVKGESHESELPSSLRSPAVSTNKPLNITLKNYASTSEGVEAVEVILQFLLQLGGGGDAVIGVDEAPVGTVEDAGGSHVEGDDRVPGPKIS